MKTILTITNRNGYTDALAGFQFLNSRCEVQRKLTEAETQRIDRVRAVGDFRLTIQEVDDAAPVADEPAKPPRRRSVPRALTADADDDE